MSIRKYMNVHAKWFLSIRRENVMKAYRVSTVIFVILFAMLLTTVGFAGSGRFSFTTITSSLNGAFGSYAPMYEYITISGSNSNTSTNTLYVASQPKTSNGTYRTRSMLPGDSITGYVYYAATADYRVLLDPAGPLMTGCSGWGKIQN